ncbi:hypothetical protein ACOMICROBIO_LMKGKHOH_04026 [Vibrio sp. B1FIG11]|uniref:hypothetical protein n=1 Tax=Vibrio TaxID=662 RepID=UPI00097FADBD|nr:MULTISPECIES: hypothetical protein [Vibrio]AQM69930.1 hypothetical protein Vca1114GL_03504 [Vibrio campbellii]CAD7827222.1 hypothetical protein ACOMICROBIO_LMKGKHOH_04026 [Vibrio sp. B1FIG11]CAE6963182.1 hypothetical protein ACOMICROBIO_LMKGKHOH_04026 [Vibrio sp. B1FIG11]
MLKQSNPPSSYDITDISHVERLVIGSTEPDRIPTEQETQNRMKTLNQYLQTSPRGRVIGTERSFSLVRIGEHQVVLEAVAYHIGFKRKPSWLTSNNKEKTAKPEVDLCAVEKIIAKNQ